MSELFPGQFSLLRRVYDSMRREARRQWSVHQEQRARYWTKSDVAAWCGDHFRDEQALFHTLRIERRLGRTTMVLTRKFELSDIRPVVVHHPGYFLLRFLSGKY